MTFFLNEVNLELIKSEIEVLMTSAHYLLRAY